jgi:hypothetical protein
MVMVTKVTDGMAYGCAPARPLIGRSGRALSEPTL